MICMICLDLLADGRPRLFEIVVGAGFPWIRLRRRRCAAGAATLDRPAPAPAARPSATPLPAARPSRRARTAPSRARLGERLVERGVVTPADVEAALERQRLGGLRLGRELADQGALQESELVRELSDHLGVPVLNLADRLLDPAVARLVPEHICARHQVIAVSILDNELTLAMVDPANVLAIDDVQLMTGLRVHPVLVTSDDLRHAQDSVFGAPARIDAVFADLGGASDAADAGGILPADVEADPAEVSGLLENEAPIIRLVNLILDDAIASGGTEVHFVPRARELGVWVRARDGELTLTMTPPKAAQQAIATRLRVMAGLAPWRSLQPATGAIRLRANGQDRRCRLQTAPTEHGERLTIHLGDSAPVPAGPSDLGMEPGQADAVARAFDRRSGLILVAGPPRSGKTTTLHSLLLSRPDTGSVRVALEDPIEADLPGVDHLVWSPATGGDAAAALDAALASGADLILIGDVSDARVAVRACRAARQGRLVLAGLTAAGAFLALEDLTLLGRDAAETFPELLAGALSLVIGQSLVPRPCDVCSGPGVSRRDTACVACRDTGFRGRTGAFEVNPATDGLRASIRARSCASRLRAAACAGA
jgi:type IV pilus assembly protein PilB